LFPICLLGQAGVGKSTLINTLVADTDIVVPSGGGTGPLTANALRVSHGERASFTVSYHPDKQLAQTRFILEEAIRRQVKKEISTAVEDEEVEETGMPEIELDEGGEKQTRTEEAIGRARLLVAGAQTAHREIPYLADALRFVLEQRLKFKSEILDEDKVHLRMAREALKLGNASTKRNFDSADNQQFRQQLRDHASGFLAPLIQEMSIQWPSPLLRDSVELVDLPGIGILSDAYASVTTDYLRNKARAVMLVTNDRGLRIEDAALLNTSGFLNRLLHSCNDASADPVAIIVVVVRIDDVAVENWKNDKAVNNGTALKSKVQHFTDQVERCREDIHQRMGKYLREIWVDDTDGKRQVIQFILDNLQVFPVSAPQYRLHCANDPDDKPFLPNVEDTNIPALRAAISQVAQQCLAEQMRRRKETHQRFFGQLCARLKVLSAQGSEERQSEQVFNEYKKDLDAFLLPRQRELDSRKGAFRNFLRETIPTQIESKVREASTKARQDIQSDLRKLKDAHWKTLQAAVRKEGTFNGKRYINLPNDFALRFESPVAEVWSMKILRELRSATREFADYECSEVKSVSDWARKQGEKKSTRLLDALVGQAEQRSQQMNAVGKEAVDELRNKIRKELIKKIEPHIRRKCQKFVQDKQHVGSGVKNRMLELFDELKVEVVAAAAGPATELLVEKFKEVEKEILSAFGVNFEPLKEAADALLQRKDKDIQRDDVQIAVSIEAALSNMPRTLESVA
jgi:GTP-binding protein EngB required for normal cell division